MKVFSFLYVVLFMLCSCHQVEQEDALFGDLPCEKDTSSILLSELFTGNCKITPLETTAESLIGSVNKIVKWGGHYYILSNDKWIFHFDGHGRYVSSLKKQGEGPDEYTFIGDFGVYDNKGTAEIWLADMNKIKIYKVEDLSFLRSIDFPFIVNKFERIGVDEILIMNGQGAKSLLISDEKGRVSTEFLNRNVPFLLFRSVPFITYNDDAYIYQLGISNDIVVYHTGQHEFESNLFFDMKNGLMSKNELAGLYDKYGQDFIAYFNRFKHINAFVNKKGNSWFYISDVDEDYVTKITPDRKVVSATLHPKCTIHNDLFNIDNFSFIGTMSFGKTPDSIMMFLEISRLGKIDNLQMKNGECFSINEEMNPFVVEFFV